MRGFQLIEVIVAGAVFFMVSLFLLNLLPGSLWAVSRAEARLSAQNLAYSTLEELRQSAFDDLTLGDHEGPTLNEHGVNFTTTYQVTSVPRAEVDYLKDVVVEVQWTESETVRSVSARSYVSALR